MKGAVYVPTQCPVCYHDVWPPEVGPVNHRCRDKETNRVYLGHDKNREVVPCDSKCGAFECPFGIEETIATLEHYRDHAYLGGCAHGS